MVIDRAEQKAGVGAVLLVAAEASEAVGESVGDEESHSDGVCSVVSALSTDDGNLTST